jgi:predicted DNA-binding transcriptional regulator AlpA
MEKRLQPGDVYLKVSTAATRMDVSMSTVWDRIKNDDRFPRPLYDGKGMARIIERELLAYMANTYSDGKSDRAKRAREAIAA